MARPNTGTSPRFKARIAGFFYLMNVLGFLLAGVFVGNKLIVPSDAAATATNILAHENLFWLGFATDLIAVVCYIAVAVLLYELFKPVNKSISLLAAVLSLVGCTVGAVAEVFQLAAVVALRNGPYLSVFNLEQLQALALMFLKVRGLVLNMSLVFFGFYCLLLGYLIFRSRFLPRILGLGMALAGSGWLTSLAPPVASYVAPYNMIAGVIGEGCFCLWILLVGVNTQRWMEQADLGSYRP